MHGVPHSVHALCVVPPDIFDEAVRRWASFDWRSGEAYAEAVRARADEIYNSDDDNIDVEIAIFDIDHFVAWCTENERREDSSRSRADWAADFPRRIPYAGSLEDLLMFNLLIGRSREGMQAAPVEVVARLEDAVDDLLDEFGEGGVGRGTLDIIAYDLPSDRDERTEYRWSFVVEWLCDEDDEVWLSTSRVSENDVLVALLSMGLVNGGCLDLYRMESTPPPLNSFSAPEQRRWSLGAHLPDLFQREDINN